MDQDHQRRFDTFTGSRFEFVRVLSVPVSQN